MKLKMMDVIQRSHLLDTKNINARIGTRAIIRDQVVIGDNAVIMMGADQHWR